MDIYTVRRQNLNYLIQKNFASNATEFARKVQKKPAYIHSLLWDENKPGARKLGEKLASKFCSILGLSDYWFDYPQWTAQFEEYDDKAVLNIQEKKLLTYVSNVQKIENTIRFEQIPVRGNAQLGDNGYWCEVEYPQGFGDGFVIFPSKDKNAFAVRCIGDSMAPRIRNGEYVIVEPNTPPKPGHEALISDTDGRVMVKTYLYETDTEIVFDSINEAFPRQTLPKNKIQSISFVAGIAKAILFTQFDYKT